MKIKTNTSEDDFNTDIFKDLGISRLNSFNWVSLKIILILNLHRVVQCETLFVFDFRIAASYNLKVMLLCNSIFCKIAALLKLNFEYCNLNIFDTD